MDVGTLYDSAPRKATYSYPSGTVYCNLYVIAGVIAMFPLENSFAISFLFSVKLAISPYRVWEAGTSDMMKIPYQRRYKE